MTYQVKDILNCEAYINQYFCESCDYLEIITVFKKINGPFFSSKTIAALS